MKKVTVAEATQAINESKSITFLTGAGVSTPSGIPDYRSLKGIYQGIEQPEYLLSHEAMVHEPQKFYSFVKKIYHPNAQPNVIHTEIARLEKYKKVVLEQATFAVSQAELVVIVGTSFQVHPFCDLIQFRAPRAKILVINQSPIYLDQEYDFVQTDGVTVFDKIKELGVNYDD